MPKPAPIATFEALYQHAVSDRHWLGPFLAGHLFVEFMLRKLIVQYDSKLKGIAEKLRHQQLLELVGELQLLSPDQKRVLVEINKLRNKVAHEISFNPALGDMEAIWRSAAAVFSDLTDGISQGLEEMRIENNLNTLDSWVFSELFVQIAYDLHETYIEMGGDLEVF